MGGRTQGYIIPHPTDNQSLHWPLDDSTECPRSPPVYPVACPRAFSKVFMLLFKGAPSPPEGPSFHRFITHQWRVRAIFLWSRQFMKSKPGRPLTTALPVRGRIVISGERLCRMNEGQSIHRGAASKFHSGISGQAVPLDDILNYQQIVCLISLQLVHVDV